MKSLYRGFFFCVFLSGIFTVVIVSVLEEFFLLKDLKTNNVNRC
jgi:hypothetical protein